LDRGVPKFCRKEVVVSTIDGKTASGVTNSQNATPQKLDGLIPVILAGATFNHIAKWYCWGNSSNMSDVGIGAISLHDCAKRCLGHDKCIGFNYRPSGHTQSCYMQQAGVAAIASNEPCAMGRYSKHWEFYQLLERNEINFTSIRGRSSRGSCSYAIVASSYHLPGILTLFYSLQRQNEHEGCEYVLVWHPHVKDSELSEAEKDMVRCASGAHHVRFVRVNDTRAKVWSAFPVRKNIGQSAILKLEIFWLHASTSFDQNHTVVYMDADMLPLQSISFVHQMLQLPRAGVGPWQLHASFPTYADGLSQWQNYSEHYIHTGFFAFRTQLLKICERAARTLDLMLPVGGDQPVINQAVYETSARLITHLDWFANYRPLDASQLVWPWRFVHWSGCNKPWGARAAFWDTSSALIELDNLWLAECAALRKRRCMANKALKCIS